MADSQGKDYSPHDRIWYSLCQLVLESWSSPGEHPLGSHPALLRWFQVMGSLLSKAGVFQWLGFSGLCFLGYGAVGMQPCYEPGGRWGSKQGMAEHGTHPKAGREISGGFLQGPGPSVCFPSTCPFQPHQSDPAPAMFGLKNPKPVKAENWKQVQACLKPVSFTWLCFRALEETSSFSKRLEDQCYACIILMQFVACSSRLALAVVYVAHLFTVNLFILNFSCNGLTARLFLWQSCHCCSRW